MRLGSNAKVDLLKSVPLFAGCSKSELRQLASSTDEVDLREGYVLMREGRPGREFFVLIDGTVRVTAKDKKSRTYRAETGSARSPCSRRCRAPRRSRRPRTSRALVLTDRSFRRVVETMPSIALKVLASVGDRLAADAQQNARS